MLKITNYQIIVTIVFIITFFPSFKWTDGGTALGQKLLHLTIFGAIISTFIIKLSVSPSLLKLKISRQNFQYIIYFLGVAAYYCFILVFISPSLSLADLSDVVRPLVYALYFFIPMLFPIRNEQILSLISILVVLIYIQIVISIFVYFEFMHPLVDIFKGRQSDDPVLYHFYRWSGTWVYPSDFSFLLSFFIYYCSYLMAVSKNKIKYLFFFLVLIIAMIFTLSRGGIATLIVMLCLFYILSRLKRSFFVNSVLVSAVVFATIFVVMLLNSEALTEYNIEYLLASFDSSGPDASTLHRLKEFQLSLEYASQYFPFGVGGHREVLDTQVGVIESYYGHILIRGGVIGLLLSLLFVLVIVANGFKALVMVPNGNSQLKAFLWASILMILSVPLVFGFSSAMSDRFKSLPIFYMLCGFIILIIRNLSAERVIKNDHE